MDFTTFHPVVKSRYSTNFTQSSLVVCFPSCVCRGALDSMRYKCYHICMKELIEKINVQIEEFAKNADLQLVKGNKRAGLSARKAALELSKLMKEFRKVSVEFTKN